MNAPWPPLRRPRGIHRRTAGLLACGVSPAPPSRTRKSPVAKKRRHAAHSRGGGHGSAERPTVFPFHPRSRSRDRARVMSQLREGLSNGGRSALASLRSYAGEDLRIEKRPARTSAGSSSIGLGGEPRGPNQVLSSHNAVILAPATMEFRVGMPFSSSAKRHSAPNSVSANRRSISCCSTAGASWVVAHDEAGGSKTQCLALILMRLDARTIPGAQTAADMTP
jgi:hypothetical protein